MKPPDIKKPLLYEIEISKKYKGYSYLVLGLPQGYRCGYVKIPHGHVLYGLKYKAQLPITFSKISHKPLGKRGIINYFLIKNLNLEDRISMDLLFDVHGGITFAGKLINQKGWWIGFDCAHLGDAKDFNLMDEKMKQLWKDFNISGEIVRTTSYVEKECLSLIDQIITFFDK